MRSLRRLQLSMFVMVCCGVAAALAQQAGDGELGTAYLVLTGSGGVLGALHLPVARSPRRRAHRP